MRKHRQLACAATLVAALAIAAPAAAAPQVDTSALRNAVTSTGSTSTWRRSQARAVPYEERRADAGHRHRSGTWTRSTTSSSGCARPATTPQLQPFEADIFFEESAGVRASRRTPSPTRATTARPASGTPPTSPATATSTADGGRGRLHRADDQASASDSGCEAADFGARGRRARSSLLQRGTCDFGLKAELAGEAGAVGAVIFNEGTIGAGRPQRRPDPDAGRLRRHASRSSAPTTPPGVELVDLARQRAA